MLLLEGVDAPPTTELANALAAGAAAAIGGTALGAAAATTAVPLIIVDRPAPAIAGTLDGTAVAAFIPLVLSSTFDCTCAVGSIADDRRDPAAGILIADFAFFFLEGFWPGSETGEVVAPSFTPERVESTG